MIFGGIAGCLAVTVTYPTDLIRRKLQISVNCECLLNLDFEWKIGRILLFCGQENCERRRV
jgi:hypothetical protein